MLYKLIWRRVKKEGGGNGEGKLVDACLSCPGTPQGQVKVDMEGLSPAWQASTGGYRSILKQANQCMYVSCMITTVSDSDLGWWQCQCNYSSTSWSSSPSMPMASFARWMAWIHRSFSIGKTWKDGRSFNGIALQPNAQLDFGILSLDESTELEEIQV